MSSAPKPASIGAGQLSEANLKSSRGEGKWPQGASASKREDDSDGSLSSWSSTRSSPAPPSVSRRPRSRSSTEDARSQETPARRASPSSSHQHHPTMTRLAGGETMSRTPSASGNASSTRTPDTAGRLGFKPRSKQQVSNFGGMKVKHLKKEDGEPLWRSDIQYDFLTGVFNDKKKIFTSSYTGEKGKTFADIYIEAMARSSKTSKVLRDKLYSDRTGALNMAMVCLLVNMGRMNTTLNFFPEMRAQLRTYHSIPSLQSYSDPTAYKQLQDAPRLKSILKGACEDNKDEPDTIESIQALDAGTRTNPINLTYVLCTYAAKVTEAHFDRANNREFSDLIMDYGFTSKSRATAFLWMMWWYLESNFNSDDAKNNPYGEGMLYSGAAHSNRIAKGVPQLEYKEKGDDPENVDTPSEIDFGNKMKAERKRIMSQTDIPEKVPPPQAKQPKQKKAAASKFEIPSDVDYGSPDGDGTGERSIRTSTRQRHRKYSNFDPEDTRSLSPGSEPDQQDPTTSRRKLHLPQSSPVHHAPIKINFSNNTHNASPAAPSPAPPGSFRINLKMGMPPGAGTILAPDGHGGHQKLHLTKSELTHNKMSRPLTSHQIAVQRHREAWTQHTIAKRLRISDERKKKTRAREGVLSRAWRRLERTMDDGPGGNAFGDSDEEMEEEKPTHQRGSLAGLAKIKIEDTGDDGGPIEGTANDGKKGHQQTRWNNGASGRGLAGIARLDQEDDDFGEESRSLAAALRRTSRRVERWRYEAVHGKQDRVVKKEVLKMKEEDDEDIGDDETDTEEEGDDDGGRRMSLDMGDY